MEKRDCKNIGPLLSMIIDGEPIPQNAKNEMSDHLEKCLTCKTDLAQLRSTNERIHNTLTKELDRHISTERLGAYVDDQINSEKVKLQIEIHLQQCRACREVCDQLHLLNEAWEHYPQRLTDRPHTWFRGILQRIGALRSLITTIHPFVRRRWIMVTAGAGIALVLFIIGWSTLIHKPSIKKGIGIEYSAGFESTAYLDEMIAYNARSFTITAGALKIGQEITGTIQFRWEAVDHKVYLKILNNNGVEIWSATPDENTYTFNRKLKPGLYYCKLESDKELLYMGQFIVAQP